jgi:hypothetical protein
MRELEMVIAGEPFMHLLYHFVLTAAAGLRGRS